MGRYYTKLCVSLLINEPDSSICQILPNYIFILVHIPTHHMSYIKVSWIKTVKRVIRQCTTGKCDQKRQT